MPDMGISKASIDSVLQDLNDEIGIETITGHKTIEFVKSVSKFFKDNGYLTPAQDKAIRDIHERHFR
jgi:hypothetical protein